MGALDGSGPALTRRQYAAMIAGLSLGTMLEFFDFQIYAGLAPVLAPLFFPASDPVAVQLGYWGVYAMGYATRPIGAALFGHVGDTRGRRLSLLISILLMAGPTVLIGCLPTYQMIGVAAPALLALLRIVQGIACGGEYGTASVLVYELAPSGKEGSHTCIMPAMGNSGILLGNLVTMLVVGVCSPEQLHTWGWRIPFLSVSLTASLAYVLRRVMPEPLELLERNAALQAAADAAEIGGVKGAASAGASASSTAPEMGSVASNRAVAAPAGAAAALATALRPPPVPLAALLRNHLLAVVLFTLSCTWAAATVYTHLSWLPSKLNTLGARVFTTQAMTCVSTVVFIAANLLGGPLIDAGLPVLKAAVALPIVGAAVPFACHAALRAFTSGGSIGPAWALQAVMLGLAGFGEDLILMVGMNIFPTARVRATGYATCYNLVFGLVGGLTPLAITAIDATGTAVAVSYGAALWVLPWGVVTLGASLAMLKFFHWCDRPVAATELEVTQLQGLTRRELSVLSASRVSSAVAGGRVQSLSGGAGSLTRTASVRPSVVAGAAV